MLDEVKPGPRFTPEERRRIQDELIRMIALQGHTVRAAATALDISPSLPSEWAQTDKEWSERYARAREEQSHRLAEVALDASKGGDDYAEAVQRVIEMEDEELLTAGVKQRRKIIAGLQNAAIQRDRLRVDTLKWYASKVAPKLYGERVVVGGDKDAPVTFDVVVRRET